jgi:hypothetical protein
MKHQLEELGLSLKEANMILMNAAFGLTERMKNVARHFVNEEMSAELFREKEDSLNSDLAVIETLREEVRHQLQQEMGYPSAFSKAPLSVAEEIEQYPDDSQDPLWNDYQ